MLVGLVPGMAHGAGRLGRSFVVTNGSRDSTDDAHDLALWMREFGAQLLLVARAFEVDYITAEDILQETWIVALKNLNSRRNGSAVKVWLHNVVLNVGRSVVRRAARRRKLMSLWNGTPSHAAPPSFESEQVRQLLWRAIADLPRLQRQCLLLRVVEGMSTTEVAECLDRSPGTIKTSVHRAGQTLRKRLGQGNVLDHYDRHVVTSHRTMRA